MANTLKQYEVLKRASLFLQQNNCEEHVAELLLQHFLQLPRAQFYANMQQRISSEVVNKFRKAVKEHVTTRIPIQHLTGYEHFYGRKFHVNEHVLIPRPETEELVERVIFEVGAKPASIVDLGTGSGVISITLALELEQATIYATDISKKALHVRSEERRVGKECRGKRCQRSFKTRMNV